MTEYLEEKGKRILVVEKKPYCEVCGKKESYLWYWYRPKNKMVCWMCAKNPKQFLEEILIAIDVFRKKHGEEEV